MKKTFGGWRVAALACAGVCVAGMLLWFCMRGEPQPEEKPEQAPKEAVAKPRKPRPTALKEPKRAARRAPSGARGARTSQPAAITMARAEQTAPDAVTTNAEYMAEDVAPARREPLFRHGAEQLLALATPSEPGMPVPPLPKITDESVAEDLAQAMKDAIGPSSNDTIRTLEIKKNVAEQKEEFRDLREDGMTFVQYVNALREKFNEDAAFLAETRKLDEALFNDAQISDKDYGAYRKELNKSLRERGLPELEAR